MKIKTIALALTLTLTALSAPTFAEEIETQFGTVERDITLAVAEAVMPFMRDIRVATVTFYAYPEESETFIRTYGKERALGLCNTKKVKRSMHSVAFAEGMYTVFQTYTCKGKVKS